MDIQKLMLLVPRRNLLLLLKAFVIAITLIIIFGQMANLSLPPNRTPIKPFNHSLLAQKIDWHDWSQIASDATRSGPGEQGRAVLNSELADFDQKLFDAGLNRHGFNAYISSKIALDRSVRDMRHKKCRELKYSSELPTVHVVVPFFNENLAALLRTATSIINRSPKSILKQVILVDDNSDHPENKEELDKAIMNDELLAPKVKILRMRERKGLIIARQTGADYVIGEHEGLMNHVIVFLDSHVEVNINWLPPLIQPIAENYRVVTCPFIDVIDAQTFEIRPQDEGARGSFDWNMDYKRLPLTKRDIDNMPEPFPSPVMAGGLFAISAFYFQELEGYDQGLLVWGGEQYEISFKIWQCGGRILDVPCSRAAHIYRKFMPFSSGKMSGNYLGRNLKRVAEVWMDEHKEHLYKRKPFMGNIDPGDLSSQKNLRSRLKCRPFSWFMSKVAFDQDKHFPVNEPDPYGRGRIRNKLHTDLCISFANNLGEFKMAPCGVSPNLIFSYRKDLRINPGLCMDVIDGGEFASIKALPCHGMKGNQLIRLMRDGRILQGNADPGIARCLDVREGRLGATACLEGKESQKWIVEHADFKKVEEWEQDPF